MSDLADIVETGFGAAVLAFGVVAGITVYSTGSIETLPDTVDRFTAALSMTFLPALSLAAWPNLVAGGAGIGSAWKLEETTQLRIAAFVAVYVFLAVVLHSLL
ncbi:hypothetical protein [Natronoglomus mannanivorans]|uniref:Uncharacterized protein n=1 Tax=Natronoglomus mannanivorans TaxID=2979990 RepID=A0AAP2YVZ1_9EURY|nr:hypothetical protein [Halobacteria archaeon AArc-xg1-1]